MDREQFAERVFALRKEGKSIRAIARELGTYKTKVQRALTDQVEHPSSGAPARNITAGSFVGRQAELAELNAALEDVLSGRDRLVMLMGEPGIGKTRIALELATCARLRGAQVLWGRCYESMGTPPYWPWAQAIRSYVREHRPEQLRSEMGAGAADIAEIVPDLRESMPDLRPPPALGDPQQARLRLFDSISAFLKGAAQTQPLVLILDNLHWADRPSLLLLEFLVQELSGARLLVVGTYRDIELSREHPLSQTLGELTKEPHLRRIPLRGLAQEEVSNLTELVSGITPPQELVEAIHQQTEGNPLFVTEAVRLLLQEGELSDERVSSPRQDTTQGWTIRIPEGVREAIGRRLTRLSDDCNRVLTVTSVIGRVFGLDQVEQLIPELSQDRLLELLEEALGARIIEEVPDAVGRYQFAHVLIQNTLSGQMSAVRRARLHGDIGEALEELYSADVESHATELAYHFAEAVTVTSPGRLVRYSFLAGEQALATYAYEEAMAHFQRAVAAKEGQPLDAETAALLFGLGRAQVSTLDWHQMQESMANLSHAFDYFAETGDVDRAVAVAEQPISVPALGVYFGMPELISRALGLVPPDSHQAGRLLSAYGLALYRETGDYEGAQEAFIRALAIAQREEDAALETQTLVYASELDKLLHHWQEASENALRAIELARSADDPRSEAIARYTIAEIMADTGDSEGARRYAEAGLLAAERLRDRTLLSTALWVNGTISGFEGNWQDARALLDRGLAVQPQRRILCNLAVLEYEVGDFDKGEVHMEQLLALASRNMTLLVGFT